MIQILGTITKIEVKRSKDGKNTYGVVSVLADTRDKVYQVTDYEFVMKNESLDKHVPDSKRF